MAEKPQEPSPFAPVGGLGAIHPPGEDLSVHREGRMEREWAGPMHAAWRGMSGPVEQVASAFLGGALLTIGLGRRSLGGSALALAGGGLLYRSLRG